MKKHTKSTKTPEGAATTLLTERELATVVGGTGGTIIVQNSLPRPQGTGGR